jgi:hypothetical protein
MPKQIVALGLCALLMFMYLYGLYKSGAELQAVVQDAEVRESTESNSGRSMTATLLGDLGRADIQAYVLFKIRTEWREIEFAKGRTYLASLLLIVPRFLVPERPYGVVKEQTELEDGPGSFDPEARRSSRVPGFAGEAMINFSPFFVPIAYGLFGIAIACVRSWIFRLHQGDLRYLLVPFAVHLCLTSLYGDSDNVVFTAIKDGLVPITVVTLSARRTSIFMPQLTWHKPANRPARIGNKGVVTQW